MKPITLLDVKEALKDHRFRDSLPIELKEEVAKFLTDPACVCNLPFYRKLLREYPEHIKKYFPGREPADEGKEIQQLAKNNFRVINCKATELEGELKRLPPGRKQIAIARYEDQVTVIVNELDILY